MPPTHTDGSDTEALELLRRRTELVRDRSVGDTELTRVTEALRSVLEGPRTVRRICLDRSASEETLAREMAAMEPVNPVTGEADLLDRFDTDRRVFVLQHPSLPDRPMNIVWVALRCGLPDRLSDILDPDAPTADAASADTAVFYSIWNAQAGLAGLGGGRELLEGVHDRLSHEFPALHTFVTLSPIPGFRRWLSERGHAEERPAQIGPVCARYLVAKSAGGRPLDPVARFHLGNGARLLRICTDADPSPLGVKRSWAAMANYRYAPEDRVANHAALAAGRPALGAGVRDLLDNT